MDNKLLVMEFEGTDGSKVTIKVNNLTEVTAELVKTHTTGIVSAGILIGDNGVAVTACTRAYFVVMSETAVF